MPSIFLGQPQCKIFHLLSVSPRVSILIWKIVTLAVSTLLSWPFPAFWLWGITVIQLSFTWDFSSPSESAQMLELPGFLGGPEYYRLLRKGNAFLLLYFCPLPIFYTSTGKLYTPGSVH